jgi:hypothetical protein
MRFTNMVPEEKEISTQEGSYPVYDDATIEKMKNYFKLEDNDELLKFIKSRSIRRHADLLDESP